MHRIEHPRRWLSAGVIAAVALAVGAVFGGAGSGVAASQTAPTNRTPPTISGTPEEGQTLTASDGTWGGTTPLTVTYEWRRCDNTGGSCSAISGATDKTYVLKAPDVGNTVRVHVTAKNADGSASSTSVPSAVVKAAPTPPPTHQNGCPTSGSGTLSVTDVSLPALLMIDGQNASPTPITKSTTDVTVKIHVSACNGRPVQGALVYVTGVPYSQFSIPPETPTDATGWATLTLHQDRFFPASSRQQLLAVFVRARKPGENLLSGISARRLISFPVHL
jgi:hypothetical protein